LAHLQQGRVWDFGGLSEEMDKVGDIWWLEDPRGSLAFESAPTHGSMDRQSLYLDLHMPWHLHLQ
jgi:hypothetical protein